MGFARTAVTLLLSAAMLAASGGVAIATVWNDGFSGWVITGASGSIDGSNCGASKEAGEPNHADNFGGASIWYTWTPEANDVVTIDTIRSQFDTLLGVYTGSSVSALTLIASNDDFVGGNLTSRVQFNAVGGTAYKIAVDGYMGGSGQPACGPVVLNWTVGDTIAPETDITDGPSWSVSSASASFSFTSSEAGSTFACQLDGRGYEPCASPESYAELADGSHTFDVFAIDPAGNADDSPAMWEWTVDTIAPDTNIADGPSGSTSSTSTTFWFASTEAGSTFACQLDGGGYAHCTSPKAYTGLTDGSHTFEVFAIDPASNADDRPAMWEWTVDTIAPDTTITVGPSGSVSSTSASFSFTSTEAGSAFACQLDGGAYAPCTSPKAYAGLAQGSHTFDVRATDPVGNSDASSASRTWTVDTIAPDTSITAGPSGSVSSASASFSFTSTEAGSTFACQLDGGGYATCTSPKAYAGLAQGSHTFDVRATDPVGNTDASSASRTWTVVDTIAPDTTITAGPSGSVSSTSASFSFTSTEAGSTFACQLDGGVYATCTSPKAYTGLAEGTHTFAVRATDAASNTDASPASRSWTIDVSVPTVAFLRPTPGVWALDSQIASGGPVPIVGGSITVKIQAIDDQSGVASFELRIDGTVVTSGVSYDPGTQTYSYLYTPSAAGLHTLQATAVNGAGLSSFATINILTL